MRSLIILLMALVGNTLFAQPFEDTLFYKSGWERPVTILSVEQGRNGKIYFVCQGKKEAYESSVAIERIKYYTSTNPKFANTEVPDYEDVVTTEENAVNAVRRSGMFSVSPIDVALLGLSFDISQRFGENLNSGIHIPFRFTTLANKTNYLSVGFGYSYYVRAESSADFFLTGIPTYFLTENDSFGALIIGLGGSRYFSEKIAWTGFVGIGPATGDKILWFDINMGLGFRFGKIQESNPKMVH